MIARTQLGYAGTTMTLHSYPIRIEKEGARYFAYSDDFPGLYGLGKTIESARKSMLKAMRLYTVVLKR